MNETNEPVSTPQDAPSAASAEAPEVSKLRAAWDWSRPLVVLLFVLTSFRSAVADWNDVPSGSMKPSILEGDRVFVNKIAYDLKVPFTTWRIARWSDPKRGDIVVMRSPENGRRLIKRVVGVPGDELSLRRNRLYVNGRLAEYQAIDEAIPARLHDEDRTGRKFEWETVDGRRHPVMTSATMANLRGHFGPYRVPEGQYFMMGDNRDESRDSRSIGPVPRDLILGRAEGVAFSLDRNHGWKVRWDRFLEGWDE